MHIKQPYSLALWAALVAGCVLTSCAPRPVTLDQECRSLLSSEWYGVSWRADDQLELLRHKAKDKVGAHIAARGWSECGWFVSVSDPEKAKEMFTIPCTKTQHRTLLVCDFTRKKKVWILTNYSFVGVLPSTYEIGGRTYGLPKDFPKGISGFENYVRIVRTD